jgi:uncharacterized phage protein gp47/JayE
MAFQVKKFDSIIASMINWISSTTSKITDFTIGSVVRTLLEAVAMELEELYYQLQIAAEEAIEESIYRTFNFPRNPPLKSTGIERFTRLLGSTAIISIPQGTAVGTNTQPSVNFETQADSTIPSITGTAKSGSGTGKLVDNTVNWITLGVGTYVLGVPVPIPGVIVYNLNSGGSATVTGMTGTTTLTFSSSLSFSATNAYQVVLPYADIPIIAEVAGTNGNVAANSITVLLSNLSNIQSVTNQSAIMNGADQETDTSRKTRFAQYIQSLARATKSALQYAALTIPQVVAALAIDDVRPTVYIDDKGPTPPSTEVWSDITQAMRNPGDAAIDLFPATQYVDDALYIGANELFDYINMHLVSSGVITGTPTPVPIWQYWNGSSWVALAVTDGTIDTPTYPLTQSGTISWDLSSAAPDWESTTVNGATRLWVRLLIRAMDTYSTVPTGDWCSLPPGLGYVNLYCHDGSGELSSTLQASVANVVELYRGCGIIVNVLAPIRNTPYMTVYVTVAANYDPTSIGTEVTQAIINHLNAKTLGQCLYVAELYQLIMDVDTQAIINADIKYLGASPTTAPADIILPSSAVLRADTSRITVIATTIV